MLSLSVAYIFQWQETDVCFFSNKQYFWVFYIVLSNKQGIPKVHTKRFLDLKRFSIEE